MPRYAGIPSVLRRLGALDLVVISERDDDPAKRVAVTTAILDAESTINSYVGARYPLPLVGTDPPSDDPERPEDPTFPHVLTRCTIHIATYYLAKDAHKMSKVIKEHFDSCMTWLKELSEGMVTLGEADELNRVPTAEITGPDRIFTRELMAGC